MRAAPVLVIGERVRHGCMRSQRIAQGHVDALAELRALGMCGIAEQHGAAARPLLVHRVAIARGGESVRHVDRFDARRGLGPECFEFMPPLALGFVAVECGDGQAPEEAELRHRIAGAGTDRQHAGHSPEEWGQVHFPRSCREQAVLQPIANLAI